MRIQVQNHSFAESFAKQLLEIGNGKMAIDESTQCITLPTNFCKITASPEELIQKVYQNLAQNYNSHQWLSERAILAVMNSNVDAINDSIQKKIPGKITTYKSIDTINKDDVVNYPTEFLNIHLICPAWRPTS